MQSNSSQFGRRTREASEPAPASTPASAPTAASSSAGGMVGIVVASLAVLAIAGAYWYFPPVRQAVAAVAKPFQTMLDMRPEKKILVVGNSRTFLNDMPGMIGDIADSARSPARYTFTRKGSADASFRQHWNDPSVQYALTQRWDEVIFQSESNARFSPQARQEFLSYGEKLFAAAKAAHSPAALVVNWAHAETAFGSKTTASAATDLRAQTVIDLQKAHRELAEKAGAQLIDANRVWEQFRVRAPKQSLYADGNHPSVTGSYLLALTIYKHLSGGGAATVAYAPASVDPEAAATMKALLDW